MKLIDTGDRWITIDQAREAVGVSRRTIYNWLNEGRIIARRTAGGGVRIQEASLWREWQQERGQQ
jgi:excisionase family DNA binding protein